MVRQHTVEIPRRDPDEIPEENVERRGDERLSVFEWYCTHCENWLGWPENQEHAALVCEDTAECSHTDDSTDSCGHVVCGECRELADSHEWILEGEAVGWVARQIFEDSDIEAAFRRALLEDLQQVADGRSAEEVIQERRELFARYAETVDGGGEN